MNDPGRVLIIGAGPTGLGAAYRLQELGFREFLLLEARSGPGGLASSYIDDRGYTWDVGGHVQFSHYRYYDRVLDRALGDAWLQHERESWIWTRQRFIPYPFQNNIHHLDPAERERALDGLLRAATLRRDAPPASFGEWIQQTFGEGLTEIFMRPYNEKVWGYPLERLGTAWMGDRVAVPDLARIRENVRLGRDDRSWGPNRTFRFPLRGGTGAIWKAVATGIDPRCLRYDAPVDSVDVQARRVELATGESLRFDHLITAMPLDAFCARCDGLSGRARDAAATLTYSSCHILGVGLRGGKPPGLARKCWIYFPDSNSPYYRVTVFSNYSPHNVPPGDGHWSLMAEVCETPHRPVDARDLERATLAAMREDGLIDRDTERVSFWHRREEHGYPTPSRGRDEALDAIREALESRNVYSRGRFGAWRYEVSNQDHAFMQGVEVVERLLGIGEETTLDRPDLVNGGALLGDDGR